MKNCKILICLLIVVLAVNAGRVNYPIRFAYSNVISAWWPPTAIAGNFDVPGFGTDRIYNYIALAFWTYGGPLDTAMLWANAQVYMGRESEFGSTTDQIQKSLRKIYNDNGKKILVSAFGSTSNPTHEDPEKVAEKLALFVQ